MVGPGRVTVHGSFGVLAYLLHWDACFELHPEHKALASLALLSLLLPAACTVYLHDHYPSQVLTTPPGGSPRSARRSKREHQGV